MLKDRRRRDVVKYRLAVGEPAGGDRKAPTQLDYFLVTHASMNQTGGFNPVKPIMDRLGVKPHEVPFFVDSDDIEDFLVQEYTCMAKGHDGLVVFCHGDGEEATRRVGATEWVKVPCHAAPKRDDGSGYEERMPKDLDPLLKKPLDDKPTPATSRCPFAQNTDPKSGPCCKPRTEMLFRLMADPGGGSAFCRFRSHGHRTADNLVQSIERIKEITKGVLRGVPLKFVLQRVRMQRPGGTYGVHSVVHVELSVTPQQALEAATFHLQTQVKLEHSLAQARALLTAPATMTAEEVNEEAAEFEEIAAIVDSEKPSGFFTSGDE